MDILRRLFHIARSRASPQRRDVREEFPHVDDRRWSGDYGSVGEDAEGGAGGSTLDPEEAALARNYANLEVPYGSDLATLRAAWRQLMKKYHPDLHARDPEKRKIANDLTARLTQAYRDIEEADPKQRGKGA